MTEVTLKRSKGPEHRRLDVFAAQAGFLKVLKRALNSNFRRTHGGGSWEASGASLCWH